MIDMSRVDYLSSAGLRILLLLSHADFLSFFALVDLEQEASHAFGT
jgi:anti-anti-sigma regulatory factor